jgi:hypothetical protein
MLVVSEETCRKVVGPAEAFTAVESVFSAMAKSFARPSDTPTRSMASSPASTGPGWFWG